MQEVEINLDFNHELPSFNGYSLLIEYNDVKSRTGIYVKNGTDAFTNQATTAGQSKYLLKRQLFLNCKTIYTEVNKSNLI